MNRFLFAKHAEDRAPRAAAAARGPHPQECELISARTLRGLRALKEKPCH